MVGAVAVLGTAALRWPDQGLRRPAADAGRDGRAASGAAERPASTVAEIKAFGEFCNGFWITIQVRPVCGGCGRPPSLMALDCEEYGMTVRVEPRAVAADLIRTTALDEAACRAEGGQNKPKANWLMFDRVTAALTAWQEEDALYRKGLVLIEWLAVELAGYSVSMLGDEAKSWLKEFGDEVRREQRHAHPAGPTAIDILSIVLDSEDREGRPGAAGDERLQRIDVPYGRYLRAEHTLEDVREVALTLALWTGSRLTSLMHDDAVRITGYLDERDAAPRT